MTVDREACTSANRRFPHLSPGPLPHSTEHWLEVKCHWFDFTGLTVGLAVMGALIVLLGILLFLAWRRMGAMGEHIEKLGAAFGDLDPNEDGASPENPLLRPAPDLSV
ncbi:hypothetical protein ACHAWF_004196 [Thalassiosira exigua]